MKKLKKLLNENRVNYEWIKNLTKNEKTKILFVLNKTYSSAPLGYISNHSGISDPYALLQQLEKNGLVMRTQLSMWSTSLAPQFELTSRAREFCKKYL